MIIAEELDRAVDAAGRERDLRRRRRDLEDAAAVLVVLAALASGGTASRSGSGANDAATAASALWGDPARRLGVARPRTRTWWASGLPR